MMTIRMGSTLWRRGIAVAAAVVAVAVGIGGWTAPDEEEVVPPRPRTTTVPLTPGTPAPTAPACPNDQEAAAAPPPALVAALQQALAGFRDVTVGVSMWVEGYGEVLASGADVPLSPASVQKVFTAMGALSLFEPDDAFTTAVRAIGPVAGGVLRGDLVLVGGGDPTLTARGPHSLDTLAVQVRQAGITSVAGSVVADESRHDAARAAPGWQGWQQPAYVGPMSALMVDDNRRRTDPGYLASPATGNAEVFRAALAAHGVAVAPRVVAGTAPPGASEVASLSSRPVPELVTEMLQRSDNETAELLAREAGLEAGTAGTTPSGTAALTASLRPLCVPLAGVADDGSGLSRADRRTAREWRQLLEAATSQPWGARFRDSLPLAGRSGTLAGRFRGTPAEGNVRAKTGTIIGGRSLAGYLTTAGGRPAVFAIVVNGDGWRASQPAIDRLVTTLAADRS
jgi:D-alanyl-D-alanine carboxypeptidase/D-alanyl-D-alanine-endopeptidase (penicillin-binding protein 4)